MIRFAITLFALAASTSASAQKSRDFCPDRPGLGTPSCTLDRGRVAVEVALADWTLERDSKTRTDTLLAGDLLVRLGVADHAEVQLAWTPYGHVRTRDRASGAVSKVGRSGDVTLAVRRNFMNPDGSGTSIAAMPFVTLPVGRSPVGSGDWGAGLVVPVSFELGDAVSLSLSPEADAAVDEDGDGRHLAFGSVAGLGVDLTESLSGTAELSAFRDRDPAGHSTETLAGLSLGWQPNDDLQLDIGGNFGLNRNSPDIELYAGIARRF